ncbi:MAG: hypothetical protein QOH58_2942 [Thermoleophilaceae bacterium]|nr:hypothetical protein [Thermoleophilaceae bacterium]
MARDNEHLKQVLRQIDERRKDKEFMRRIRAFIKRDKEVLDRLRDR